MASTFKAADEMLAISRYLAPERPLQLKTKQIHYNLDDEDCFLKDNPVERVMLVRDIQVSDNKYEVGELVWAQIGAHPYWPAMVSPDPYKAEFHKFEWNSTKTAYKNSYHLQYFVTTASVGWTDEGQMILFRGYDQVMDQLRAICRRDERGQKLKALIGKFKVEEKDIWSEWNAAIAKAEAALKLDIKERIQVVINEYIDDTPPRDAPRVQHQVLFRKVRAASSASATETATVDRSATTTPPTGHSQARRGGRDESLDEPTVRSNRRLAELVSYYLN